MHVRKPTSEPLAQTLSWLNKISPAQTLIHVGAGQGLGPCHVWRQWSVEQATLIDADPARLAWTESLIAEHPSWQITTALLADHAGEANYHSASNADESGLIPTEALKSFWPNLSALEVQKQSQARLDDIAPIGQERTSHWLIIDCLPALPILRGAPQHLANANVLCLRCLLSSDNKEDLAPAGLEAIKTWLEPLGFRCVEVIENNHPALGHAVFVRDWYRSLQPRLNALATLEQEKSALAARRDELEAQIKTISQASDEQTKRATDQQTRIDALAKEIDTLAKEKADLANAQTGLEQEKSALATRHDELEAQIKTLTQARDEQTKHATDQQTRIDSLAQELDTLAKEKAALEQEKSALATRRDELEAQFSPLTLARDEQTKLAEQRKTELEQAHTQLKQKEDRINQLEAELTERDARQHLLNEEITRAEAQIDLIKDVLLREPGL